MSSAPPPIRVYLLDDHEIVRLGIRDLVDAEDDMEVIGESGQSSAALLEIGSFLPDVAVIDIRLGDDVDGIAVCTEITRRYPDVRCMILTSFDDDGARLEAAEAGAVGFVLKQVRANEIVQTIRTIAEGRKPLDATSVRVAKQRLGAEESAVLDHLTSREREVFDLIGAGRSNREIGEELFVAEKTVKNYVTAMLSKLQMERRTEAAALAARIDERRRKRFE